MNPIEMIISIWKRPVEEPRDEPPSDSVLRNILQITWMNFDHQHFRSCVGRVVDDVYYKVLDMEVI